MAETGRPSTYSEELATSICERIAEGESLVTICKDANYPCFRTVFNWINSKPEFLQLYARARESQLEKMAQEINEIADNTTEDANSRRVRVDTRKWLLSKLIPKVYGDATLLKHADPDGNALHVKVTRVNGKE